MLKDNVSYKYKHFPCSFPEKHGALCQAHLFPKTNCVHSPQIQQPPKPHFLARNQQSCTCPPRTALHGATVPYSVLPSPIGAPVLCPVLPSPTLCSYPSPYTLRPLHCASHPLPQVSPTLCSQHCCALCTQGENKHVFLWVSE